MSTDFEGRRNSAKDAEGGSGISAVYNFIKDKLDEAELREFCKKFDFDPDTDMAEPPRDYGMDARHRKLVTDGFARTRLKERQAYDEHRESLGLRPIRNLGP